MNTDYFDLSISLLLKLKGFEFEISQWMGKTPVIFIEILFRDFVIIDVSLRLVWFWFNYYTVCFWASCRKAKVFHKAINTDYCQGFRATLDFSRHLCTNPAIISVAAAKLTLETSRKVEWKQKTEKVKKMLPVFWPLDILNLGVQANCFNRDLVCKMCHDKLVSLLKSLNQ